MLAGLLTSSWPFDCVKPWGKMADTPFHYCEMMQLVTAERSVDLLLGTKLHV